MFGMSFGIVSLAAIVRSIESSTTKMTYILEDHTGQISAHYWLENTDDNADCGPDIMINNYAMVFGNVRFQGSERTVMVFKMFPITSPNEVSTHALEALFARFKAEEYQTKSCGNGDFSMANSTANSTGGTGAFATQNGTGLGLETKQRLVYEAIRDHMTTEGISRNELQNKFKHIQKDELTTIIDFLVSEGHAYSSIDSDHFLSTD